MVTVRICILSISVFAPSTFAFANAPLIPDTPAGHVLAAWFDAFNSGDRGFIEAFIGAHRYKRGIDEELMLRKFSGGFDLVAIEKSGQKRIVFRVKEKNSSAEAVGKLVVNDADLTLISSFGIYEAPPGSKYVDFPLDSAERNRVVTSIQRSLDESYVFPDVAKKLISDLQGHLKRGDYDSIVDGEIFSQKLTDELVAASHDKHLEVDFYLLPQPESKPANSAEEDARYSKEMARENCGFEKAEHLPGNIGYLKLNTFAEPLVCGETAVAAMGFLANSDALIFDLRENGGGAPRMIALLSTYLFEKTTHLNDFYRRRENETTQLWTLAYIPGKRLVDMPIYVLTSKNTFSAAEEFSYNLKVLKRATLIGETTGGGAHPVGPHRIDEHFTILVPFARAINPITKANWEGVGVEPDIKVPAADALDTAIKFATQSLGDTQSSGKSR